MLYSNLVQFVFKRRLHFETFAYYPFIHLLASMHIKSTHFCFEQEYEELTTKLHKFSQREEVLKQRINESAYHVNGGAAADDEVHNSASAATASPMTVAPPPPSLVTPLELAPPGTPTTTSNTTAVFNEDLWSSPHPPPPPPRHSIDEGVTTANGAAGNASSLLATNGGGGGGGSGQVPKSPARIIIRAHLSGHGHSCVQSRPGVSIRDALSKAMKFRKLAPETCAVYKLSDPTRVRKIKQDDLG